MRIALVFIFSLFGYACSAAHPYFSSTKLLSDTTDTQGPYLIEARLVSESGIREARTYVRLHGSNSFSHLPMIRISGDTHDGLWNVTLAGSPVDTVYEYYLEATDHDDRTVRLPSDAPTTWYTFRIISN